MKKTALSLSIVGVISIAFITSGCTPSPKVSDPLLLKKGGSIPEYSRIKLLYKDNVDTKYYAEPINGKFHINSKNKEEQIAFLKAIEYETVKLNGMKIPSKTYVKSESLRDKRFGATIFVEAQNIFNKGGTRGVIIVEKDGLFGSKMNVAQIAYGFSGDRFYISVPSVKMRSEWRGDTGRIRTKYIDRNGAFDGLKKVYETMKTVSQRNMNGSTNDGTAYIDMK